MSRKKLTEIKEALDKGDKSATEKLRAIRESLEDYVERQEAKDKKSGRRLDKEKGKVM